MHKEHRQRLRYSFLKDGLKGSRAYEIVELLLTLGTHRIDCKQLIKQALTNLVHSKMYWKQIQNIYKILMV